MPDILFNSNNEFGIPTLFLSMDAGGVQLPIVLFGSVRRNKKCGTLIFYTDDYRFEAVWKNPDVVIRTGAAVVAEVNFSVYSDMPRAVALWQIYRKRWLSRYFQMHGIRVLVDLNVATIYSEDNLLGVPEGYGSFITRGYSGRLNDLKYELDLAKSISGRDDMLFVVYGGGDDVRHFCIKNDLCFIPHYREEKREPVIPLPLFVEVQNG